MLARLRYVGEHVFGGDLAAYAAAVGLTEHWLRRILNNSTRFRVSTFMQFVESGIVSAEWLFCGTGPMLRDAEGPDVSGAFSLPVRPNSRYPVFDTLTLVPQKEKPGKKRAKRKELSGKKYSDLMLATYPLAQRIYNARAAGMPVVLFLTKNELTAAVRVAVCDLINKKYVSGIAMTGPTAIADYTNAKSGNFDPGAVATVIKRAAREGVGLGEAFGRWGFLPKDDVENSVLATAYDVGIPVTVHDSIGSTDWQIQPALSGVEFGAMLGSVLYVDSLVFAAQFGPTFSTEVPGIFISTLHGAPFDLFHTALYTQQRTANLSRATAKVISVLVSESPLCFQIVHARFKNAADDVFAALLTTCDKVYEGVSYESFDASEKLKRRRRLK